MGSLIQSAPNYFPLANISIKTSVYGNTPYKSKSFLYQKYVIEGLSCEEISTQIFSARTTVLKYLKTYGIPVREVGTNQKRVRGLAYGKKIKERNLAESKREMEALKKMRDLRERDFSYWKIAEILNTMKVPTKTRRGKWHARSVHAILNRQSG
jgi:hypothetical protein